MTNTTVHLFTDGGARGNPGPAGIGGVLKDPATGKILSRFSRYLGERTNNQAEYEAVINGLDQARNLGVRTVQCFLDSQLVAEQLSRRYKVKNSDLAKLFVQAWNRVQQFDRVTFQYIPREQNREADALVNRALDERETPT